MKVRSGVLLAAFVLTAGSPAPAEAAPVTFNDTQVQTVAGQVLLFSFLGAPPSDGAGGKFVLHAQDGYDGTRDETLTWNMDGLVLGGPVGISTGGAEVGGPFDFFTVLQDQGTIEFQRTYSVTGPELDAVLADGFFDIWVELDWDLKLVFRQNYVEVTTTYNSEVPDPGSTMLLLGLGLVGLRAWRRRRP